ncbi:hypothetical protein ACRALDRAFT_2139748 [Sodiomyces alcalophilus JCM 7366]|uniref:uncharacterized protein n=1 Tax=Sodiomyces alcalophilus JCM 7366 TaxID=591952 RepID=UPI0039B68E91
MLDPLQSKFIEDNPIGNSLDAFRASFHSIYGDASVPLALDDALEQLGPEDLRNLVLDFLPVVQSLPAACLLPARTGHGTLRTDLLRLELSLYSDNFDLDCVKPLLKSALSNDPDSLIWRQAYNFIAESTLPRPPRPITSSVQDTPWLRNTSSFANSFEHRKYVDNVLKEELGPVYIGLRDFHDTYFGGVDGLAIASEAFFKQCQDGPSPLFRDGWRGWPPVPNQDDVLNWLIDFCEKLVTFSQDQNARPIQRRLLARPNQLIHGPMGKRRMDIGFIDSRAAEDPICHWSQVLVPGELNSSPSADKPLGAWLDLGRHAREVFAAPDTRRFVLGFTICGSVMRVWAFDRVGGIASEQFDINDGLRFVFTILGFLWMDDEQLGFDPTVITTGTERHIEIQRNGSTERIIIDKVIHRARRIAGRGTTCWKAHPEGYPEIQLVVKDSWQCTERDEEGELLHEVMEKGVVNIGRYCHHETVQIRGIDDDIRNNIRRGLDITTATNYQSSRVSLPSNMEIDSSREGRSSSTKRPSSQTDSPIPPSKRSCSAKAPVAALLDRVHRRIILRDYGKPIYKASSRSALLFALVGCLEGHESLYKAGILHRDISINNLMINEDSNNPSWPSFLIDLDLATRENRARASGEKRKTGTRAFMAIGVLLGEQHSFMHDLESFFWVLFWICIHYDAKGEDLGPSEFDTWNYESDNLLAMHKQGLVADEEAFLMMAEKDFSIYYRPLLPWVNRLRRKVFPDGRRWKRLEPELYTSMKTVLREAGESLEVVEGG